MAEDQDAEAIKEFEDAVDNAVEHINGHDYEKAKKSLDDVNGLLKKSVSVFIKKHHGIEEINSNQTKCVHYTSVKALLDILKYLIKQKKSAANEDNSTNNIENISLRAYDTIHFNDPDEGAFFTNQFLKKHKGLLKNDQSHAHIASFITPPHNDNDMSDKLVFWRTYGKDGKGCSLSLMIDSSCLRKVVYGRKKALKNIRELKPVLDKLIALKYVIKNAPLLSRNMLQIDLENIMLDTMEKIRYLYKSDAYDYENECRFVLTKSEIEEKKICFEYEEKSNNSVRIRHYYEHENLKIKNLLTTGSLITLGPRVINSNSVKYYIEALLRRADLYGPKVKVSKISYRKS